MLVESSYMYKIKIQPNQLKGLYRQQEELKQCQTWEDLYGEQNLFLDRRDCTTNLESTKWEVKESLGTLEQSTIYDVF